MWSKILWYNRKTTLVGAIDGKKFHETSLWRQYDVITQKWRRPGPKIGKITKNNIENQEKIAWWWLTPQFLYFYELFQKKIVSLTFNTNKASKSVKNENHNFRLPPTTGPYFRKYRWQWSKNFRKHVKLNFVSLKISPGLRPGLIFQILRFPGVWVILPPPNQNRVKGEQHLWEASRHFQKCAHLPGLVCLN